MTPPEAAQGNTGCKLMSQSCESLIYLIDLVHSMLCTCACNQSRSCIFSQPVARNKLVLTTNCAQKSFAPQGRCEDTGIFALPAMPMSCTGSVGFATPGAKYVPAQQLHVSILKATDKLEPLVTHEHVSTMIAQAGPSGQSEPLHSPTQATAMSSSVTPAKVMGRCCQQPGLYAFMHDTTRHQKMVSASTAPSRSTAKHQCKM
jgi:hypothetical protein